MANLTKSGCNHSIVKVSVWDGKSNKMCLESFKYRGLSGESKSNNKWLPSFKYKSDCVGRLIQQDVVAIIQI